MADYAISAVRYDAGGTLVQRVRLHEVRPGGVGPPLEIGRDELLGVLKEGRAVITIRREQGAQFAEFAPVRLVGVRGRQYLRCDGLDAPSDNLAGLIWY